MARFPSSATPIFIVGLAITSTLILTLLLRKAWRPSRGSRERQTERAAYTHQSFSPSSGLDTRSISESGCTDRFEEACAAVESAINALPNASRLEFYGLFKQATHGDCEDKDPSSLNPTAHAKWSAWQAKKGIAPDEARAAYEKLAIHLGILRPTVEESSAARSEFGPVHSRPLMPQKEDNRTTSKGDQLCCLAAEGKFELVKEALSEDASLVNVTGDGRMTALHFAADRGYADIVKLLIDCGAHVNHTDDCGETPLHVAIAADQAEIISLLLKAGADTSIKNSEGYSCAELLEQSDACRP